MSYYPSLPRHIPEQIALYQTEHLLTHPVCRFDPARAASRLHEPQTVMAIDIGGDKLRWATYSFGNGGISKRDESVFRSRKGEGYLSILERLARHAIANGLRVGISSATKLDGSVVTRTVNLPIFFEEFREKYGADYENLFPGRSFVANDTVTGVCGAGTRLVLQGRVVRDVAFFICASGLGASVIKDDIAIHVEAGHVPVVSGLNPFGQTRPCGVEGKDYVCVERVTAARAGIEDLYQQQTGEPKDGVALGTLYEAGDALVTTLYETSVLALAHAAVGVMDRYAFDDTGKSVVIFHGGNLEITKYRDAVSNNLRRLPRSRTTVVFSRDLSDNVCLDGAAILAVYSTDRDRDVALLSGEK